MHGFDATPQGPVLRLYELISGPADHERPWTELESLFMPGARLRLVRVGPDGAETTLDWSVDEFSREAAEHYRQRGFWEREIWQNTERFGSIAHVLSTYESRVDSPDSSPVARGVNSFQVLRKDGQWKIAGIIFQTESDVTPIPGEYLP